MGGDHASGRRVVAVANGGGSLWKERSGTDCGLSTAWRSGSSGWGSIARDRPRFECARSARKIPSDCICAGTGGKGRDGAGTAFAIRAARGQVHRKDYDRRSSDWIEGKSGGGGDRQSLGRRA